MGTIKASVVVMSHLSDAQESMNPTPNENINFAKWIILRCNGDLTKEINPDKMYDDYLAR